jgi:uncharacterized protein (UPF0548 family)
VKGKRSVVAVRGQTQRDGSALLASQRLADVTYADVGATIERRIPNGFAGKRMTQVIGHGEAAFTQARLGLQTWAAHRGAGVEPFAETQLVRGGTVLLVLGLGPAEVRIACRIVDVTDTPLAFGFVYGTLPVHPECGEERFLVEYEEDGTVRFTIDVFWKPNHPLAVVGAPVARRMQHRYTQGYLDALARFVSS